MPSINLHICSFFSWVRIVTRFPCIMISSMNSHCNLSTWKHFVHSIWLQWSTLPKTVNLEVLITFNVTPPTITVLYYLNRWTLTPLQGINERHHHLLNMRLQSNRHAKIKATDTNTLQTYKAEIIQLQSGRQMSINHSSTKSMFQYFRTILLLLNPSKPARHRSIVGFGTVIIWGNMFRA